jgi:multidrug efflux pump subunit AcrB
MMGAMTTVLGMIPLLWDILFAPLAVTIMFGLTLATGLTLVIVPVLYVTIYRIPSPSQEELARADSAGKKK